MALSGFPELLPAQRFVENDVLDRLRRTFELHGFAPLETPAVESLDQLLRKGEIDKEVYVLRRLHADADTGDSGLGLHFDLTVPFARYVLEHAGHLEFPFRRYQIQKVWRGERPQEGRYREFTQADIDVVARDTLPFHHDVEIARVMAEALGALDFLPALRLQVNNRRLIEGFYRGLGATDVAAVMRVIDKLDKVPAEAVAEQLQQEAGLDERQAGLCLQLAEIRSERHRLRRAGARARRRARAARQRSGRAGRGDQRLRGHHRRHGRGRPAHRPRPGLLHRHGVRDPDGRLRGARLDLLRRAVRLAGLRRAHHLSRRRHLARRHPAAGAAAAARRAEPARGPVPSAVLVALPDEASRPASDAIAQAPARAAASPPRSRPRRRSTASRSATPSGAASRSSGSRASRTRSRTSAAVTRSRPTPRPGTRPTTTCARRCIVAESGPVIRTHDAGTLRASDAGQTVTLAGWVATRRDHGGVTFIDLRDRSGSAQVVLREADVAHDLRNEWVVEVTGEVRLRPEGNVNTAIPTGEIEVVAESLEVLNEAAAAAVPARRAQRGRRGGPAEVPLPRPAPRRSGRGDPAAQRGQPGRPRRPLRPGLHRDRDADADPLDARGRARLPRAGPAAAGQLVRAAAVAAAVQAAADGGGHGALLPDRALLPRRGLPRRPAARVHPARHRDELRRPGRRHRAGRGGAASRCGS